MSLLRKGTITRRGGLPTFHPTGLAPQKVAETDEGDATRDTYQRKVFYDGTNFFVVYWTGAPTREVQYVASADGVAWTDSTMLWGFSVAPYYGGNIDVQYPNRGSKDSSGEDIDLAMHFTGSNGATSNWRPFVISAHVLTQKSGGALGGLQLAQGGSVVSNLNGARDYMIFHRASPDTIRLHRSPAMQEEDFDTSVSHGGATTGGNQLLPYKTSSPYNMLALAKSSDEKLYYNIVNVNASNYVATFNNSFIEIATLGTGFSDFCACSEAQDIGDPERIHLVYVKSTDELCYRKFENDIMGSEQVLVASGASYPMIVCGSGGKLYVLYVKDGKVWVTHFNGSAWLRTVELFTKDHTYNTPVYLSSNQNVQNGKICLVWTEGSASPYVVWFCYLED